MKTFVKHLCIASIVLLGIVLCASALKGEAYSMGLTYVLIFYTLYFLNAYFQYRAKKLQKDLEMNARPFWALYSIFIVVMNATIVYLVALCLGIKGVHYYEPLLVALGIGLLFYAYYYTLHFFQKKNKAQALSLAKISRSERAARSQIGAHFLFNSLNILHGLIEENPQKAQNFITDMAEVYRYILDEAEKDWALLKDEIKFAKVYLNLIQIRFEGTLNIQMDAHLGNSNLYLAPLTLQLLLENIIKHNALSHENKLNIEIYQEQDFLVVKNNLNPKRSLQKRKGTGLQNIITHYANTGKGVKIQENASHFIVKIPLLKTTAL
uniref:sensor histidine kinase n=1 Tax=Ornithobacterium rhinotracheale TaxID=28251 RepID=UPI0039A4FFE6